MVAPPEGAQRSEDGRYWWDGDKWQLIEKEPEDVLSGSFLQTVLASSDAIADDAVKILIEDPYVKALHDTDPSAFKAIIKDVVEAAAAH